MIKSVTITNHLGESLPIELSSPEKSSGLFVRGIDGLGPVKATINTTELVANDGSNFNSARVILRNIVLSLGFIENPTIEITRQNCYRFFPVKRLIKMAVESDIGISETYGYVESNEPSIFSSSEGAVISVICPDPYFYSDKIDVTLFSDIEPTFEFPFSNESLTEKLLSFSDVTVRTEKPVVNSGNIPTGIVIYIHAMGHVGKLTIIDNTTLEEITIDDDKIAAITQSTSLVAGDDIIISTIKGNHFAILRRNGQSYNIRNALDKNVAWFQLEKGDNMFAYTTDDNSSLNAQFRIESQIAREGI